jgi:hypothetical protein
MNIDEFRRRIESVIQEGTVLDNPGKGTSKIEALSEGGVLYMRPHFTF